MGFRVHWDLQTEGAPVTSLAPRSLVVPQPLRRRRRASCWLLVKGYELVGRAKVAIGGAESRR